MQACSAEGSEPEVGFFSHEIPGTHCNSGQAVGAPSSWLQPRYHKAHILLGPAASNEAFKSAFSQSSHKKYLGKKTQQR
jgi:hypothetical protein